MADERLSENMPDEVFRVIHTAIAGVVKGSVADARVRIAQRAARWVQANYPSLLREALTESLYQRTGAIAKSGVALEQIEYVEEEGTDKARIHFSLTNVPEHGYTQEFGRDAQQKEGAWTMVPVASAFRGSTLLPDKYPKGKDIFWAPTDKSKGTGAKNWFKDRQGNLFKAIFQRTVSTKGISKARKDWRQAPLVAKTGRRSSKDKLMMEKEAKLLAIVYPNYVPGIPGMSKGKFAKKPPKLASDLVQKYGFSSRKGMQASRWATRTVIKINEGLIKELKDNINAEVAAAFVTGMSKHKAGFTAMSGGGK
jgi:hypothetical protein